MCFSKFGLFASQLLFQEEIVFVADFLSLKILLVYFT